jgi:hypothetical protein
MARSEGLSPGLLARWKLKNGSHARTRKPSCNSSAVSRRSTTLIVLTGQAQVGGGMVRMGDYASAEQDPSDGSVWLIGMYGAKNPNPLNPENNLGCTAVAHSTRGCHPSARSWDDGGAFLWRDVGDAPRR